MKRSTASEGRVEFVDDKRVSVESNSISSALVTTGMSGQLGERESGASKQYEELATGDSEGRLKFINGVFKKERAVNFEGDWGSDAS